MVKIIMASSINRFFNLNFNDSFNFINHYNVNAQNYIIIDSLTTI